MQLTIGIPEIFTFILAVSLLSILSYRQGVLFANKRHVYFLKRSRDCYTDSSDENMGIWISQADVNNQFDMFGQPGFNKLSESTPDRPIVPASNSQL
jgi:hypothetical protein